MKIHYLQHVPFEDVAYIGDWAKENGIHLGRTRLYLNSAIVAFARDARHRACSCSVLPQTLDNAVDPVNAAIPQGN